MQGRKPISWSPQLFNLRDSFFFKLDEDRCGLHRIASFDVHRRDNRIEGAATALSIFIDSRMISS